MLWISCTKSPLNADWMLFSEWLRCVLISRKFSEFVLYYILNQWFPLLSRNSSWQWHRIDWKMYQITYIRMHNNHESSEWNASSKCLLKNTKPWTVYARAFEYVNAAGFVRKIFKWIGFYLYHFAEHWNAMDDVALVISWHFSKKFIDQTEAVADEL